MYEKYTTPTPQKTGNHAELQRIINVIANVITKIKIVKCLSSTAEK